LGLRSTRKQGSGENFITRNFMICIHIHCFGGVKSRRMRWAGHVAQMEEESVVYRILVGKPEGKRSLGRTRCRREYNIKMVL
jgi:hypothetical protein